ncbi:hypothetical protein Tco_1345088 [Tanacetum coccineum]
MGLQNASILTILVVLSVEALNPNNIEWFKRGEALQAKKVKALKSTRAESSNANRSKTPTKSGCSRHMTGVKSYLHKYVEQPGPKVVFGDDSTCITKGYGSIKCNGIVFIKFDEKRGTIFNSNKEVVMISPRGWCLQEANGKQLSAALAHECLFVDFLFEEEPKKVKTPMVPPNNSGPDLTGKDVNETQYRGFDLKGYSDSDYACCNMDTKSTSDASKAEYVAAARCYTNILWMKSQLTYYDIIYEKVPIFCDNTSAIAISTNSVLYSRTKHIDIRYHILKRDIELHFIPT